MSNLAFQQSIDKTFIRDLTITVILFLINPLLSIVLIGSYSISQTEHQGRWLTIWIVLLSSWISLVNITKVSAGDQISYLKWYEHLSSVSSIKDIIYYKGDDLVSEPAYGLFQYICYVLFGGNTKLFLFTVSFLSYYLILSSLQIVFTKANQGIKAILFGSVCCVFFNQYFYSTLHLIRQVLAFSVAIYAIARKINDGKNHWFFIICAPLIHNTAALFSGLSLLPFIYHRMNMRQILVFSIPLILVTIGSVAFGGFMANLLNDDKGMGYAFARMSTAVSDGTTSSPIVVAIMLFPLLTISFITLIRLRSQDDYCYNSALYPIIYIFIFLAFMILSMSARPIIQLRFVFVTYQLMPFILPLLFDSASKYRNTFFVISGLFFILRFFILLPESQFQYLVSTENMLFWPAPLYFNAL